MKRHILTLAAAVFVIACLLIAPATARAEEVATTGTWGTNITWAYDQETKTLTFTGTGDMDEGAYDEETGWFTDDELPNWISLYYVGVDHIVVGEGITSLCPYAFCEFLCKSISLPSTLKTLRPHSLDTSCTGILKLPSSIERVDSRALSHQAVEYDGPMTAEQLGCLCLNGYLEDGILYDSQEKTILYLCYSEAASITLPDSVKTIKANAFLEYYRNSKPLSVVVPDTVETVEDNAFTDVDHVIYHGSLATSSWRAKVVNGYEEDGMIYKDSSKTNLLRCTLEDKNIVIPDTVLVIGPSIFRDTKDNVTVPATVTEISNYAFNHVGNVNYEGSLTWTYWGAMNYNGYAEGYFIYENSDKKAIIKRNYYYSTPDELVIPDGVERIEKGAFNNCYMKTLKLPASVNYIGQNAFSYCNSLQMVEIENVETIDKSAFYRCRRLKKVEIKAGLKTLEGNCFENCYLLETVILPDTLKEVQGNAFGYDENLYDIEVSASVETVADNAFFAVSNVNYKGTLDTSKWNACTINGYFDGDFIYADSSKRVLTSGKGRLSGVVYVPYGVEEISDYAFYENAISRLVLPTTVKKIGKSILYYNRILDLDYGDSDSTLTSIAVPARIEQIPHYAYAQNYAVKTIFVPKAVLGFGFQALDVNSLSTVYYEGTAEEFAKIKDSSGSVMTWGSANIVYEHTHTTTEMEKGNLVASTTEYEGHYDYYEICTECGATVSSERVMIPRVICNHDGGIVVKNQVDVTCTTDGYSGDEYCKLCNAVMKFGDTVSAMGHTIEAVEMIPATTTKDGASAGERCTVCDYSTGLEAIPSIKTVALSTTKYTYSGAAKKPAVTVTNRTGAKLVEGTDYTVSYASGRKNVGKYSVKVTFKGFFSGTKTLYFTIVPKGTTVSTLTGTKAGFKATWKKQATQTTGYQLRYSTSSKMTSAKTVTISSYKTVTKTVSKLKSKKKYYVQVRTYKTVSGTKYYSAWSKSKTVTTK